MLNSEEIIAAIHGSYATGSKNGFQNVLTLLDKMHVALRTPIVHVAGTNGKGSTCAMLESVLRRAGYHTGLYTSPFLQAYQERIRLDGLPLDDARMVKYGNPLVQAAEEISPAIPKALSQSRPATMTALMQTTGLKPLISRDFSTKFR